MRPTPSITALLISVLAVLAGCANSPPEIAPVSGPAAPSPAPAHPTLAAEQQRLAELFRGTPVVFAMQPDGGLRVTVPLHFCFDRGAGAVKPPLAAVLDRIAKSQRDEATRLRVAAPADPGVKNPALVRDRAQSTRDYLAARGISMSRLTITGTAPSAEVEIVVTPSAPH
jgi:outer membrane protein OmpA-like peptidoglycan-associated protein